MGRISPKPTFASQTWVTNQISVSVIPDDQNLQEVCDFGATTTVPITVSTSGSSFASSRFTGDIDAINHNIVNLSTPTSAQDAATKKYVDDTSGSIGTDLNDQIHKTRVYVDDNTGANTSATLDNVCDNGSLTDNTIQISGSLAVSGSIRTNTNIYVNHNGPYDGDSFIYFYNEGSATGEYLKWDDAADRFEFSDDCEITGSLSTTSYVQNQDGRSYLGSSEKDSYRYFYENGSTEGAYLMWDDSSGSFSMNHGLNVGSANNYTEIKDDGEINLHGTARVRRHIRIAAPSWKKGVEAPTDNQVGVFPTLAFDSSADDSAYYDLIVPFRMAAGSTIDVTVDWCYTGAQDDGTVCWGLEYLTCPSGSVVDGTTTTITETSPVGQMTGRMIRTTFTAGITGTTAHDALGLRLYRDVSEDTLATDAELIEVHFSFLIDKLGEST